ncbi:hypothetical protein F442_09686, partial [Phytophthora nicotianae P10297]
MESELENARAVATGEKTAAVDRDVQITDVEAGVDELNASVSKVRRTRRQARRAAKRQRVMVATARLEKRHDNEQKQRRIREVRSAVRLQERNEALERLEERRRQRDDPDGKPAAKPTDQARVSLVKQQKEATGAASARSSEAVEYVGADDGLPTARMEIEGVQKLVKLDSCARYTIAGTEWMTYGDKLTDKAPVDYVEGIGGFLLDVIGVWRFEFRSVFGEAIRVDACIVAGCTDEFLLGVDFMKSRGATMDFNRNEVRYSEAGRAVVIPFRTIDGSGGRRVAVVRMVGKQAIAAKTVTPVEVSVTAEDGERGVFVPLKHVGSVMLAATVTTANNGKAWVPAINANDVPARLPNKKELGTWIPVEDDMTVLSMNEGMSTGRINEWLDGLGDGVTPLPDESEVHVGVEDPAAREMVLKLLRVYRKLSDNESD